MYFCFSHLCLLVVNGVLRIDHKIGRKAVKVEKYHDCLGKLSHGDQASVSDISGKTRPEQVKRGPGNVASSIKGAEAQETGQRKVGMKKPQVGQRVQVPFQGEQGGKASVAYKVLTKYKCITLTKFEGSVHIWFNDSGK